MTNVFIYDILLLLLLTVINSINGELLLLTVNDSINGKNYLLAINNY